MWKVALNKVIIADPNLFNPVSMQKIKEQDVKNDIINLKDSDVEMSDTDSIYDNACSDEVQQAYVDKMNELDSKVTHN